MIAIFGDQDMGEQAGPGRGVPARSGATDGKGAWQMASQQVQARRGRTIRFTTNRPGT